MDEAEQTRTVSLQKAAESGHSDVQVRLIQGDAANENDIIRVMNEVTGTFGATVTPINEAWTEDQAKKDLVESYIPMGRAGTVREAWSA